MYFSEQLLKRVSPRGKTADAIEDRLQDGVLDTIKCLKQGNIKVWVLTGDKQGGSQGGHPQHGEKGGAGRAHPCPGTAVGPSLLSEFSIALHLVPGKGGPGTIDWGPLGASLGWAAAMLSVSLGFGPLAAPCGGALITPASQMAQQGSESMGTRQGCPATQEPSWNGASGPVAVEL